MSSNTRTAAYYILNNIEDRDKTLDSVIEDFFNKYPDAHQREKSFLFALVYGVLRWRGRLDWIIEKCSGVKLKNIEHEVLNILRLGLFQIIFLDRVPVSAAVNTSVELAKKFKGPWIVKYVNAVLRKAAGEYNNIKFPDHSCDPAEELAISMSFPKWMVERWLARFGYAETKALLNSMNQIPDLTVRTNTLKISRKQLFESLSRDVDTINIAPYAPDGICFSGPKTLIYKMESFQNGWFQVQDEAAQLVTFLFDPRPGETVLDACAGLGGKTGHIAQLMKNKGKIIAIDNNEDRLNKLESEIKRLGISIVSTKKHDLTKALDVKELPFFDKILLDAPCSGIGVIRRNPDIKWMMNPEKLTKKKEMQIQLLNNLAGYVKPSGIITYAVCSMEPEENEEIVNDFLKNHEKFVIEKHHLNFPLSLKPLINEKGFLKTYPHIHNMDGFFAVSFRREK